MGYSVEQLSDLEAIRDVAMRYAHGVDRLDAEWMKSAYWPDATDNHGVFEGNAWEFVDFCMKSHTHWRSTLHCNYNHQIALDDDSVHASGEIYNVSYLFRADTGALDTWFGRYLDQYEKRDGEWRILQRVCVHEGSTTGESKPMPIDAESFRPGAFDRPSRGRPLGP